MKLWKYPAILKSTLILSALIFLVALPSCTIELAPELAGLIDIGSGSPTPNVDDPPAQPATTVEVRFRNFTPDQPVDVQFHVSQGPLATLPADLFVPENQFGIGIGLGGNGRLAPANEAVIEIACANDLIFGTQGGVFVDIDTGDVNGTGTPLWLRQDAQFTCGSIITFEFVQKGQVYDTFLLISR